MARTAKAVVIVGVGLTLASGKRPVRINQTPSKIIPRFLPAKVFVSAMSSPSQTVCDPKLGVSVDERYSLDCAGPAALWPTSLATNLRELRAGKRRGGGGRGEGGGGAEEERREAGRQAR